MAEVKHTRDSRVTYLVSGDSRWSLIAIGRDPREIGSREYRSCIGRGSPPVRVY